TALFPNQKLQLLLYGYLLEERTFDVESLNLVCVLVARRNAAWLKGISEADDAGFVARIEEAATQATTTKKSSRDRYLPNVKINKNVSVNLWIFPYRRAAALKELKHYAGYWLGAREAAPAGNVNKCRRCLYNAAKLCTLASAEYDQDQFSR